MKGKYIGIIILAVIIVGILVYYFGFARDNTTGNLQFRKAEYHLEGYIGSEKNNFLKNEEVKKILLSRYGIEIDFHKAGSIEMIRTDMGKDADFLWPSSQVALELFFLTGKPYEKTETIFNSPIVLYSWDRVTEKLINEAIAEKKGETYWVTDMKKLITLVLEDISWKEIGLGDLFSSVTVVSTDPTKSNSGNMFAGLLANLLYDDIIDLETLPSIEADLHHFFGKMGYMQHSTGILFEDEYLTKGMGQYPIIVGYENQIVEFSLQNPDLWKKMDSLMTILYPVPTVWSSHPLIALTEPAVRLIEALEDEEIQQIAWKQHGFRTGIGGIQNNPKDLEIRSIPDTINSIIPMPKPDVMDRIIELLE